MEVVAKKNNEMDERFLDAAAVDAVGAGTAADREAFAVMLAEAGEDEKAMARELRETAAKLSAGVPFMAPPPELRGRILAETAPGPFKMEEYRRKADVAPRWQHWGMVAAALFLTASTWYSTHLYNKVHTLTAQVKHNGDVATAYKAQAEHASLAIAALTDAKVTKIQLVNEKREPLGMLVQDPASKKFLVIMPKNVVPPGAVATLTIEQNGKQHKIEAVAVGGATGASSMQGVLDSPLNDDRPVNVQIVGKDGQKPVVAGSTRN